MTIRKAKTANVAPARVSARAIRRLAAYPLMRCAGMIGIATRFRPLAEARRPFGGREHARTNPISIAVPSDLEAPSTSTWRRRGAAARSRCRLRAAHRFHRLDHRRRRPDTTDPNSIARRRAAAARRQRGLQGKRPGRDGRVCASAHRIGLWCRAGRHNDGCFMAVFNVAASALEGLRERGRRFARYSNRHRRRRSPGVFYPGESIYREQKASGGIEIRMPPGQAARWPANTSWRPSST